MENTVVQIHICARAFVVRDNLQSWIRSLDDDLRESQGRSRADAESAYSFFTVSRIRRSTYACGLSPGFGPFSASRAVALSILRFLRSAILSRSLEARVFESGLSGIVASADDGTRPHRNRRRP